MFDLGLFKFFANRSQLKTFIQTKNSPLGIKLVYFQIISLAKEYQKE
jgi:hypothetical protein